MLVTWLCIYIKERLDITQKKVITWVGMYYTNFGIVDIKISLLRVHVVSGYGVVLYVMYAYMVINLQKLVHRLNL